YGARHDCRYPLLNGELHFSHLISDIDRLVQFVHLDNYQFRAIKAATPGPYTFILPATGEVPKRFAHPKKRTVGVRIPEHRVVQALLRERGEPILSSTLILPDVDEQPTDGRTINEERDHLVHAVIDAGEVIAEPTTVADFSDGPGEVVRVGSGDRSRFA